MRGMRRACLLVCLLTGVGGSAVADDMSTQAFMEEMFVAQTRALVSYCVTASPKTATKMQRAYLVFSTRARTAIDAFMTRHADVRSETVSEQDVRTSLSNSESISKMQVDAIREYNADSYCGWLAGNLEQTTSESFQEKIETAFAGYRAKAKQQEALSR